MIFYWIGAIAIVASFIYGAVNDERWLALSVFAIILTGVASNHSLIPEVIGFIAIGSALVKLLVFLSNRHATQPDPDSSGPHTVDPTPQR